MDMGPPSRAPYCVALRCGDLNSRRTSPVRAGGHAANALDGWHPRGVPPVLLPTTREVRKESRRRALNEGPLVLLGPGRNS